MYVFKRASIFDGLPAAHPLLFAQICPQCPVSETLQCMSLYACVPERKLILSVICHTSHAQSGAHSKATKWNAEYPVLIPTHTKTHTVSLCSSSTFALLFLPLSCCLSHSQLPSLHCFFLDRSRSMSAGLRL